MDELSTMNECLKHALGLQKPCGIRKYSSGIAKMDVPKR